MLDSVWEEFYQLIVKQSKIEPIDYLILVDSETLWEFLWESLNIKLIRNIY